LQAQIDAGGDVPCGQSAFDLQFVCDAAAQCSLRGTNSVDQIIAALKFEREDIPVIVQALENAQQTFVAEFVAKQPGDQPQHHSEVKPLLDR